jgi:anti-sigma factor RsiW
MNRPHLNDDELIGRLYGLGNVDDMEDAEGHLAVCPECGARWSAMQKARAGTIGSTEISGRRLAVQRQQILERLERPSGSTAWRWVPAAAVASLLAVGLFLSRSSFRPNLSPAPAAVNAEADAELFTDVYSMERDVEPRAAAPIRALFVSEEIQQQ